MSWLGRGAVIVLAAGLAASIAWALWPRPRIVDAARAEQRTFERAVEVEGRTHMRLRHVATAPLGGTLGRVRLEVGDRVEAGSELASISTGLAPLDNARIRSQLVERLGAAEAAKARGDAVVARGEARVAQARADLGRTVRLVESGTATPARREQDELALALAGRDLDVARSEVHMAEHELDLARAALGLVDRRVESGAAEERIEVRTPIAGVVLKVHQESAGPIAMGTPILEIADPDRLEVVADVLTTDAVVMQPGDGVQILRWGGPAVLDGVVRRIEPAGFTKVSALGVDEQRTNVLIDIAAPRETWPALGDAFRVDARIVLERTADATVVPVTSLFRDGDGWSLFVVEGDRAVKRPVEVAATSGRDARIVGGVAPGALLVDFPDAGVRDGGRVAPRDTPAR
ncbi:efflux RND transporter periplasmic adaptor subunit [Prosthecomicrobium hirschii]|uniref:efflux RND transporter periplasmic adaptor subunit n=1 Tax=Prosthecodimorpha hirschii TaxID=665126 RepID=UPI00221FE632|nr:HlyD family efflux transporter periplasmic adaptor subunit [Prosthecomicrobium hirschii]MCW1842257.1 HlyD family efflux transporter periplasmic adaptor subunit [Prosthecomicrobium hirschii]